MKQFLLLILITTLFACSSPTDSLKLTVGKVTVMAKSKPNNKKEFAYGESFNIVFDKVGGLKNVGGKVFPEALIYILNESKDTIETIKNVFDEDGINVLRPVLNLELMAVLSEATNKNYELKIKVTDSKGDKFYDYAMPFTIIPNDKFFVRTSGLTYTNIYLLDKNTEGVITDNNISPKTDLVIVYEGLDGFAADKIDFIYPAASAKIVDVEGTVLVEDENLLKNFEALGYNYKEAANNFMLDVDFETANAKTPIKLAIELYDLKSSNKLVLETSLNLQ